MEENACFIPRIMLEIPPFCGFLPYSASGLFLFLTLVENKKQGLTP